MAKYWPVGSEEPLSPLDNRLDSPVIVGEVLRPLEERIHEYSSLMHRADEERAFIDEEIRLREERKFVAQNQLQAARAKREEYQRKHTSVATILRGRPERPPSLHRPYQEVQVNQSRSLHAHFSSDVYPEKSPRGLHLEPSTKLTHHQIFYIFVMHGIGSMIISGGVNFGLAYAMYTTQDTKKSPIRLLGFPNTLAGDAAVTIIIQSILTWFIEKGMVRLDLSNRGVQPIGFVDEPVRPWIRWLFLLPSSRQYGAINEKPRIEPLDNKSKGRVVVSIFQNGLRAFFLAIVGFILIWPPSIGIMTKFGQREGGDYRFEDRWIPQIFKGILGGVHGLLATPCMASFWLLKAGWEGMSD